MKTKPSIKSWLLALSISLIAAPAWSATITVAPTGGDYTTIQDAVTAANPGDTITVAAGTYALTSAVALNKANLTIQGDPSRGALVTSTVALGASVFNISASGVTIEGLRIQKTDKAGPQSLILIGAANATVRDCEISGQFVLGDGDVSRGFEVAYGTAGLTIEGNSIYGLRQPGYLNGSLAAATTGTISNNSVYGTRGWVIAGANMTFTGNTWGTGANANYLDIAILSGTPAAYYADLPAISAANNGAAIEDQRSSPSLLTTVYVNASAPGGGNGTVTSPFNTISAGVSRVMTAGAVSVAAGNYAAGANLNKSVTLMGAQAGVDARSGRPAAPESVITGGGLGIFTLNAVGVTIDGFKFSNLKGRTIDTYYNADNFTMRNCILAGSSIDPGYNTGAIQFGGGLTLHANGLLFEQNLVTADNGQLFYMGHAMDNGTFRNNKFNGDSVSFGPFGERTGWMIEDNVFDGDVPGHGPYWGFAFNANLGDVVIRDNVVSKMSVGIGQITVAGGSITGNTFNDNSYAAFQLWGGEWGSPVSHDVLIENNTITYNGKTNTGYADAAHGIRLRTNDVPSSGIDASTIHIHNNSFTDLGVGETGTAWAIRNNGNPATAADATLNYWGSATPDFGTLFSGSVSYMPYYTDAAMTLLHYPVTNITQNIGFMGIQPAINAAAAGDALAIDPGTYTEQVLLNKSLTIQGANHLVAAGSSPGVRGAESILDGGFIVSASGAKIDGMKIQNGRASGSFKVGVAVAASGVTVEDTIIENVLTPSQSDGLSTQPGNDNLTLTNCTIRNNWRGLYLNPGSGHALTGNLIDANNGVGVGIGSSGQSNLTLTGNVISNNTLEGWGSDTVGTGVIAQQNNFINNGVAVAHYSGSAIDATRCYWGNEDGPTGTTNGVSGSVGFSPWYADAARTLLRDGIVEDLVITTPQTFDDLYIAPGTTVTVTPEGSLAADKVELAEGAEITVNGGELDLGQDSVISGTFTIFNSFGSWDINGDTTFNIGQSLALISDIHVAAGKTVTVNGGGELILDGCIMDSQTPGTPYNFTAATDGLLTLARCVVTDANIDINTTLSGNLRSRVYDNSFITSDIEASAAAKVYHNLLDAATDAAKNSDATAAFDAIGGWANVTSAGALQNKFTLDFEAPAAIGRTLDVAGNLFVQPADAVVVKMDVAALGTNTITAAEALLGYNSGMLTLAGSPTRVTPLGDWEVIAETAPAPSGLGIVDSALGLQLNAGQEGISAASQIASVNFTAGSPGLTLGFFRVQTNGQFNPDGTLVKDTRLTKSTAGVPSLLEAFTANTGELVIDNQLPAIATTGQTGTQVQPTNGTVDVLNPANYVIRNGTPVMLSFTATDAGLAGLDAPDATADLVLSAYNGTTTLGTADYTVTAVETAGVVTYTVTLNVPTTASTGTYAVTATVRDRSGNVSPLATLGSFQIANEVLATVELEAYAGGTRQVVFTATNSSGTALTSWTKNVVFTGTTGIVPLEAVPSGTAAISAKTAWNLRSKVAATFTPEGVEIGGVSLTGTDKLPGGDITGDNVVNTLDYSVLRYHWLTVSTVADINGDASVNLADYGLLKGNFYTIGDPQ